MMGRCYRPGQINYKNYGARGVTVCEEWRDSATFLKYLDELLGPCPLGYSLDRIDNSGNYEPGNVRWASRADQSGNRRPRKPKVKLTHPSSHVWVIA